MFKIVSEEAQPLHELDPSFPPSTSDVLRKGMAKDPSQRFATCAEFVKNLSDSLEGRMAAGPVTASTPVSEAGSAAGAGVVRARKRFPGWAIALGAGALVIVILLTVLGAFEPRPQRRVEIAGSKEAALAPAGQVAEKRSDATAATAPSRPVEAASVPAVAAPAAGHAAERHSDTPAAPPPLRPVEVAASPAVAPPPASHAGASPPDAPAAPPPPVVSSGPHVGDFRVNSRDGLRYVWIPPGTFMMGCSPGDNECATDEKPARVTILKGFWLGQTDVTQGAYQRMIGSNPSHFEGDNLPVEWVSWD
jgi:hypothetical protein